MQTTMHIHYPEGQSNYRLRSEPVNLHCKAMVGYRPDGDGWEQVWVETDAQQVLKDKMRVRGARKQRAAKANIKIASRTVEPVIVVNKPAMVKAILANEFVQSKVTRQDDTISKLKKEIADLIALMQKI